MPDFVIPALLSVDGLIAILLSVLAHEIGLDSSTNWGYGRLAVLVFGIMLVGVFPLWVALKNRQVEASLFFLSDGTKAWIVLGHVWAIIIVLYVWFATYGNFTTWDHTTHYYTQLADAFSKGHLYLDRQPDKALLDAPDPFDENRRPAFDDEMWDLSLYKGKLYLYWGPVPALLITPLQMAFTNKITDNYLVFFFFTALLVINSLILLKLRKIFFPHIPVWNVFIGVALIGLILPVSWSLSTPNVYEAAIGAGQFFLMGGIYFVLCALEPDSFFNQRSLFLTGAFWACSVASRAINVFSVLFLVALAALWTATQMARPFRWRPYLQTLTPLFMPLMLGAFLIGWYNWARFDSPLDFGIRYMITIFNLNKDTDLIFKPEYFWLNLYLYIFQPFQFIPKFPFIQPVAPLPTFERAGIVPAYLYGAGRVTGFLFGMPFLVLSLAHLIIPNKRSLRWNYFLHLPPYDFIRWLLVGSFLINFISLLFYFFGQTRFLVDVISQITLLAILGYWQLIDFAGKASSIRSKFLVLGSNLLIVYTIGASLLLALTGESSRMQTLNPAFFDKINSALHLLH